MAKSIKRSRAGKKAALTRKVRKTTTAAKRAVKKAGKKVTGRKTASRKTAGRTARRRTSRSGQSDLPTTPREIAGRARKALAKLARRVKRATR